MYEDAAMVLQYEQLVPKQDCPQWFRDMIVNLLSATESDTLELNDSH